MARTKQVARKSTGGKRNSNEDESPPTKRRRVNDTPIITDSEESDAIIPIERNERLQQASDGWTTEKAQGVWGTINFEDESQEDAPKGSIPPGSVPIALWCADPKPQRLVFASVTFKDSRPIIHFELSGVDQKWENVPFRPDMYTLPPGTTWDITQTTHARFFSKIKFTSAVTSTAFDDVVEHVFQKQRLKGASERLIWRSVEDMKQSPYIKDLFDLTTKFQASDELTGVFLDDSAADVLKYIMHLQNAVTQVAKETDFSYQKFMGALKGSSSTDFTKLLATVAREMSQQPIMLLQQQIELRAGKQVTENLEVSCEVGRTQSITTTNLGKLGLKAFPCHIHRRPLYIGRTCLMIDVDKNKSVKLKDCNFEPKGIGAGICVNDTSPNVEV